MTTLDVSVDELLALERAVFAFHDGDERNPFDHVDGPMRHRLLRRVRWRHAYEVYLASDAWRDKRAELFDAHGRACEACGNAGGLFGIQLDVHHLSYLRIGDEPLEDLMALCRPCHDGIEHERRRRPRRR